MLVAFTLLALLYSAAASRLPSTRAMLLAILPLYVVAALGNALTHAFWALHFAVSWAIPVGGPPWNRR